VAEEVSLKGLFVRKLLEDIASAEKRGDLVSVEKLKKSLEYGIRAFEGQVKLNDY